MTSRCRWRLKSLRPSSASSALTWWLTAPWVTQSSSAARVKLSWRAAASKAFRAFRAGRRRSIDRPHEKSSVRLEKGCFGGNRLSALPVWPDGDPGRPDHAAGSMTNLAVDGSAHAHDDASRHAILRLSLTFRRWIGRHRQRKALGDLAQCNSYILKDIGISHEDAQREAGKWFWQA